MEIKEQIKQRITADPAFAAALKEAKTPEEALNALLAAGIQLTMEELMAMAGGAEVSDTDLDQVSGGVILDMSRKIKFDLPLIKDGLLRQVEED